MSLLLRALDRIARRYQHKLVPLPLRSERLDVHLQRLFALLEINCVLDVGANRGQYGHFLRAMGYGGDIISLEPVTADFAHLRQQAEGDPHWHAHRLALGDEDGEATINVTSDSLFNSFLPPNDFIRGQGLRIDDAETVPVRRLDTVFAELSGGREQSRVYLKLDTQGYDLQVLAGAAASLPAVLALQSELAVRPVYEGAPPYREALARLEEAGYEPTGFFPIARDNALRVVEFDCVMIRRDAAGATTGLFPPG